MPALAKLLVVFLSGLVFGSSSGFLGGDMIQPTLSGTLQNSDIIKIHDTAASSIKRYVVFGSGTEAPVVSLSENVIYSVSTQNGFFAVGVFSEDSKSVLQKMGYAVLEDFELDFHQVPDASRIGHITGSEYANNLGYTGKGVGIGIVDTGVDFSNPDIQDSLARDKNNKPIMLDADGQGLVLTNATFIANIDKNGILRNYTKDLPDGITSNVYKTKKGVFLNVNQNGKGTIIQVYNSFYPQNGPAPIFNGTISDDMKIGIDNRNYIQSKSGIYHLGVMYQGSLSGSNARLQVVPVLVVDSEEAGIYDTIIADMSTSWKDFTKFDLPRGKKPNYDFDFTDETPIKIGSGKEFLVYDFDDDGKNDYSAGTVGAHVVDVYNVIDKNKTNIHKTLKAINGTLLPPLDPNGEFFGVMTDFMGHGTSSAASIVSAGKMEYDIYNNTKKYKITGVAPQAKIIPIKALWFGDAVYGWLWASGFDNNQTSWKFSGSPRVDILSNSWGVSNFPILDYAPGMDVLSLILDMLVTPHSVSQSYPGVVVVSSAGNSGHGYGTLGLPNAAPFGITVGATTNNVFVGYGPFADQPRFGNSTEHLNDIVDFSSRGPGVIGDPKPDVVSIGAHGFTPSSVTKLKKDSKQEPFSLFGGTSMAAPLVSGSAALVLQALKENQIEYDPFLVKNILVSTATDLKNDPLTQGAGLVNVTTAIKYLQKEPGYFMVYNDATYPNLKKILDVPIQTINATAFGFEQFKLPKKNYPVAPWFAGHLIAGQRSTTTFTIDNPSDAPLEITITPQTFNLIKQTKFTGKTVPHQQDPVLNKSGTFAPNYIRLADVKQFETLADYYDYSYPIPDDASLLSLNLNFAFDEFMNKTDSIYANDLKIASLYLYDWNDANNDTKISSNELSLVNRAGSWGTVQEMRVSDPNLKFQHEPVVGVYPVPFRYSYWHGQTQNNATQINYTLSASYYTKDYWNVVWLDKTFVEIPPKSKATVDATIYVPTAFQTGVYQGFLTFESDKQTSNIPVSFVVKQKAPKDSLVYIKETESQDVMYGNGYVKGAFDMVNRYMAGDWRYYYFEIEDPTIDTASIEISWQNDDSSFSVFAINPQGQIVQTNVPSGVFGHFMSWPSNDWLGPSPFSQGGGFFPVKNIDKTSTVLQIPINQTGTYGLMMHSTLFDGNTTEPFSVAAKFTDLNPNRESLLQP